MTPPDLDLAAHTAYLRGLARALVGAGADADDLVQDTLVAALEHPPRPERGLRAWLGTVARNRARDLRRGAARRGAREADVARPEGTPDASEAAQCLDLAQRLAAQVARLGEPYRTAIYLRYHEGHSPTQMAERLGVPVKTVKTRLARALEELRARMDAREGGREAWGALLLPLAFPRGVPGAAATASSVPLATPLLGGLAVKKLAVALLAVVVVGLAWKASAVLGLRGPMRGAEGASHLMGPERIVVSDPPPAVELPAAAAPREALPMPNESGAAPETGALVVHLRWAADGAPLVDACVDVICLRDPAPRKMRHHARTDAAGTARFDALAPGRVRAFGASGSSADAVVSAGGSSEVVLEIHDEHRVQGRVVDPQGAPVAGAGIWVRASGYEDGTHRVATSAVDGSFALRGMAPHNSFGAVADGFQPSLCFRTDELPLGASGAREVTLELGPLGGRVAGRVVDHDGTPVADARVVVAVTGGFNEQLPSGISAVHPEGLNLATASDGTFEEPGDVKPGRWPVVVAKRGRPEWRGEVLVVSGQRAWVDVTLERGGRVRGRVLDLAGRPAADVEVMLTTPERQEYQSGPFAPLRASTDAAGLFDLDWIPPGTHALLARDERRARAGRALASVEVAAGSEQEVELVLDRGATIEGRVVDEAGEPLEGWLVRAKGDGWIGAPGGAVSSWRLDVTDRTDASGAFVIANLDRPGVPDDVALDLSVGKSLAPRPRAERRGVRPGGESIEFVIEDAHGLPGKLAGRLLTDDGSVPQDVTLTVWDAGGRMGMFVEFDRSSGAFAYEAASGRYLLRATRGASLLLESGPHEVREGATRDVGVLELGAGGRIEVLVEGALAAQLDSLHVHLTNPGGAWDILRVEDGRMLSLPLAPGTWYVRLEGRGAFAPDREVEVRTGETTQVRMEPTQGLPVDLGFEFADPGAVWGSLVVEVTDGGGERVRRVGSVQPFHLQDGALVLHDLALPPGRFEVSATTDSGLAAYGTLELTDAVSARGPHRFTIR